MQMHQIGVLKCSAAFIEAAAQAIVEMLMLSVDEVQSCRELAEPVAEPLPDPPASARIDVGEPVIGLFISGGDQGLRIAAEPHQCLMQPIGSARSAAGQIAGHEVDNFQMASGT